MFMEGLPLGMHWLLKDKNHVGMFAHHSKVADLLPIPVPGRCGPSGFSLPDPSLPWQGAARKSMVWLDEDADPAMPRSPPPWLA